MNKYDDDAFHFISQTKADNQLGAMAWQLARALRAQKKQRLINGDWKDMNIFFKNSGNAVKFFAVGDYGKATNPECEKCKELTSHPGDFDYNVAPEVRLGQPSLKSDIWSFGVLLIECQFGGNMPFFENAFKEQIPVTSDQVDLYDQTKEMKGFTYFQKLCIYSMCNPNALYEAVKAGVESRRLKCDCLFLSKYKELIVEMLNPIPENRPSADKLVNVWEAFSKYVTDQNTLNGDDYLTESDEEAVHIQTKPEPFTQCYASEDES